MRQPLEHADDLLAEMETLTTDSDLMERLARVRLILSDHALEQQRLVPLPAVVVQDERAKEIARVFEVQGQCIAAIRWNPQGGEDYWGSAVFALAGAVGSCAVVKIEADADDITERVLNAAIDEFEAGVNPVLPHDPSSHKPLN